MHETAPDSVRPGYVRWALLAIALTACGGAAAPVPATRAPTPPIAGPVVHHLTDPDLQPEEPRRLLAIDWAQVAVSSDAEALALWRRIAPTGDDWDRKLEEIPTDRPVARALAGALLRAGHFACAPPPPGTCAPAPLDTPPPGPTATLDDPCLRRLLALWSLAQLEESDVGGVHDALRAIAALPPPESELVAAAIGALPETDQDGRFELIGLAAAAGQTEIANRMVGTLDEAHLIAAAGTLHVAGALEILSAEGHRAVYLAAITDERMAGSARAQAIAELVGPSDQLAPDARAALITATGSADCAVAARAARALVDRGDKAYAPRRPPAHKEAPLMRAMCVLASYERLQHADEGSLLPSYVPARGLERVTVSYDALSDRDPDGDGDPHTASTIDLVKRDEAMLPDVDDLVRAMRHCTGTTCVSNDCEFRFTWKPLGPGGELLLARLAVAERPPCADCTAIPRP